MGVEKLAQPLRPIFYTSEKLTLLFSIPKKVLNPFLPDIPANIETKMFGNEIKPTRPEFCPFLTLEIQRGWVRLFLG